MGRRAPPLGNCGISRAGVVHRSGNAEFHAQERSTAQKLRNSTRRMASPLGNCGISRAGDVHRSGITESHAQEKSNTQKKQNHTTSRNQTSKNNRTTSAK